MQKKTMLSQCSTSTRYGPRDGVRKNVVSFLAGGGVASLTTKCLKWSLPFILICSFLMLKVNDGFAQECGTSAAQIPAPQQTAGQNANDGPYALRLYLFILRQSNGDGGLSSSDLSVVLKQINQDYAPHNIRFSVACIEDVPNSVLYNEPDLTITSNIGLNITDGICLFLAKKKSGLFLGKAQSGGNQAWAAFLDETYKRIPSHELGHVLSLYHTFRGSQCSNESNFGGDPFGDPNTTGDEISDTAPDPGDYPSLPSGCENWTSIAPVQCGTQVFTQNPGANVLRNIMSYAELACRDRFTTKQGERMRNHIQANKLNMVVQDGWVKADTPFNGADRYYNTDLVVSAPATLTISCNVYMAKGKKIIVEPGATIKTTSTALLTNWPQGACANQSNGRWAGIELQASDIPYNLNMPTPPAKAILSGGTISNSNTALYWNMDGFFQAAAQPVVSATSVVFKNNVSVVYFFQDAPNFSDYNLGKTNLFTGCEFILDGGFLNMGGAFLEMARLECVRNTRFRSCFFSNEIQSYFPLTMETYGIHVFNSPLYVEKGNASGVAGFFEGFTHGVNVAQFSAGSIPLTIKDCTFQKLKFGIRTDAVNGAFITGNTFFIGSPLYTGQSQYGLYHNTGTGFTIQENHFNASQNNSFSIVGRGLYVNAAGSEINFIKENDFHGSFFSMRRGILVDGKNRSDADPNTGLSLLCNESSDHTTPFGTNIHINSEATIQRNQGSASNPAGNEFSHTYLDYQNGGPDIVNYFYYTGSAKQNPTANSSGIITFGFPNPPKCTPTFSGSGDDLVTLDEQYALQQSEYAVALGIYQALMDGGNTTGLLSTVQTAHANGADALKNTLLGLSPYLSETVLSAAFHRFDIFSNQSRYELLLANPDVLKSGAFMALVSGSDHPLSEAQLQALRDAIYTSTARTNAEAALSELNQLKSATIRQAVHILQSDSIAHYAALRTWWGRNNGFESSLLIADSYLAEQNKSAWQQQVNTMSSSALTTEQATDLANYSTLQGILFAAALEGRYHNDLNVGEVGMVEAIAMANNRHVSRTAKNLLEWYYGYTFSGSEAQRPEDEDVASEDALGKVSQAVQPDLIRVHPNPADQEVIFEWSDKPVTLRQAPILTVFDSFGQRIAVRTMSGSQIRIHVVESGLHSGMYFYTLSDGSVNLQTGKFIVR